MSRFGSILFLAVALLFSSRQAATAEFAHREPSSSVAQSQAYTGPLPPATVRLLEPEDLSAPREAPTLTPALLNATLSPGESISEDKLLHLPGGATPGMGDLLFCFDLTGSMWGALNNAKVNSVNIMNTVRTLIPDTDFGVISHMDYPGYYSGCGYSNSYGDAACGDYPYSLDQSVTSDVSAVAAAINALYLGCGDDFPENYSRPLYEAYADANIGWRMGSKRIIVQWVDDVPHDCDYRACIGLPGTTGPDPGRDQIVGTADDLEILEVLDGLAANNIVLLALLCGNSQYFSLWDCYAQRTGGRAFQINWDGSIPGGTDIADFIADIIGEELQQINHLSLQICTPGYEDWLTGLVPDSYTDVDLDEPRDFEFEITFTVPDGTPGGVYSFDVCAVGDGATYATQHVTITVPAAGVGACCFRNALCRILDDERCLILRGTFMGDGSLCDPNPCIPGKSWDEDDGIEEQETWGRIKDRYLRD